MSDPSDSDYGIDEYIEWLETFDPLSYYEKEDIKED